MVNFDNLCKCLPMFFGSALSSRLLGTVLFPLTNTTEARYGEIARKMLESGNWITPRFDYGVPFWGKPPLHTWLSASGMAIFGVNEFGARIFIFLCALLTLLLIYMWVQAQAGKHIAWFSVVVTGCSAAFVVCAAAVMTDMVLTLGTTMSMIGFYRCVTQTKHFAPWGYLFFLGLAVGMLAKGPIIFVLVGLATGLWVVCTNRWSDLRKLPLVSGGVVLLCLTVPWFAAAEFQTPGFLRYFFVGEHFERYVVANWQGDLYGTGHEHAFGTIWLYTFAGFLPWSFLLIFLLLQPKQSFFAVSRSENGFLGYLLCWPVTANLFFSFSANILPAYVLPAIPATAIFLVAAWSVSSFSEKWPRFLPVFSSFSALLVAITVTVIAMAAAIAPNMLRLKSQKELVAIVQDIHPSATLSYLGGRNFSAEFYTSGTAKYISAKDLSALNSNEHVDFVAVPVKQVSQYPMLQQGIWKEIGTFGRTTLFHD